MFASFHDGAGRRSLDCLPGILGGNEGPDLFGRQGRHEAASPKSLDDLRVARRLLAEVGGAHAAPDKKRFYLAQEFWMLNVAHTVKLPSIEDMSTGKTQERTHPR